MKNYEYLIADGKDYQIKQFKGFMLIIVILWVLIALALIIWSDYLKTGIGILAFASLLLYAIFKPRRNTGKKIIMNNGKPESFEVDYPGSKKPLVFLCDDVQDYELRKIYYARILINVELMAVVNLDGKMKKIPLSQSMRLQPMQNLLNELEDLIQKN